MIEKFVQRTTELIDSGVWKKWHVFWVSLGLTLGIIIAVQIDIWAYLSESLGVMAIFSLLYPLRKLEDDKVFAYVRKFPVEAVGAVFAISFLLIADSGTNSLHWSFWNHFRALRSAGIWGSIWFIMLYSWAYLIAYAKFMWRDKSKLREQSWLAKFYVETFKSDLGKGQGRKLIFEMLGHGLLMIVAFIVLLFTNDLGGGGLVVITSIVGLIAFYIVRHRKKLRLQRQYQELMSIAKQLSQGDFEIGTPTDVGMFSSLQKELMQVKEGFKKAVHNEIASERMKTDLITNVSHDLKTPLTAIITYVDLLQDDALSDELRHRYLNVLEQKSHRLKDLIEDLFEMSRVTSGIVKLNKEPLNVVSLLKQTLSDLSPNIEEAGLTLRNTFPESAVMLNLDGQRTHRVFENLIINMTKYALKGTRAYLDIEDSSDSVAITLRNISATELTLNPQELMERFVRADGARTTEGSGLGLAIAKSLVDIQGGAFHVQIDGDLFKVQIVFPKN